MSTKRDSQIVNIGTTTPIHQLIFDLTDGLRRANDAMLGLVEHKEFAQQKKSLREDTAQLRELRCDILAGVLQTWQLVEEDEMYDLESKRVERERRVREADRASVAKAQARLKRGAITQVKPGAQTKKNVNGAGKSTKAKTG